MLRMMQPVLCTRMRFLSPLWVSLVLWAAWAGPVAGQSLENFGYDQWATRSRWPALAVLVDYEPATTYNTNTWNNYVFDPNNLPEGVNRYYQEASLGRFLLQEGGTIRVVLPVAQNWPNTLAAAGGDTDVATLNYHSNLVHAAIHSQQFDFHSYDTDGDNIITGDELLILFLLEGEGGAVRWAGRVGCNRTNIFFRGSVGTAPLGVNLGAFKTMVHEMTHLLGAADLYGIWGTDQDINRRLSIMSSGLVYPDPWHKMRFGWCEPRITNIVTGGKIVIPAAQMGVSTAPVILWNPSRGSEEYFLLEYRSPSNTVHGTGYDREVAGDGLVIWHVYHDSNKNIVPYCDVVYPSASRSWYECGKCRGLVHRNDLGSRTCAGGGTHEPIYGDVADPSDEHTLVYGDSSPPNESPWYRCNKCGMIYFGPNQAGSVCPSGGVHSLFSSLDYSLRKNTTDLVGHNQWYRCTRCESLFYTRRRNSNNQIDLSGCPAGGNHIKGADEYVVNGAWTDRTMLTRGAPDLLHGSSNVWASGSWTPYLDWYNKSSTGTRLHVYDYQPGANSITVEWFYPWGEIWVDFNYAGIEEGSFARPFNTFAEGVAAVGVEQAHQVRVEFGNPHGHQADDHPQLRGQRDHRALSGFSTRTRSRCGRSSSRRPPAWRNSSSTGPRVPGRPGRTRG